MPHVALLGDSIFDNASYVPAGSSVVDHLRSILPTDWRVTLLATDGATTSVIPKQLERLPKGVTHLVLSAGGNDALWMSGNLYQESTSDVRTSLQLISDRCQEFRQRYRTLIKALRETRLHLALCTIYDAIPDFEPSELTGLCFFNDTISRVAFENSLPLIDLRVLCSNSEDYSTVSTIEPSTTGGLKIARAISKVVQGNAPQVVCW